MTVNDNSSLKLLSRDIAHKKISGVCAGLAKYTSTPVWMWEAGFIVASFMGGIGVVAYIALAILMPIGEE